MTVYLVGAGPGDPDLITVKGRALIAIADVILYDRLSSSDLLAHAPATCLLIPAGKEPGRHEKTQDEINDLLVAYGRTHAVVVRLKGGDPFVFGRGGEEAERLVEAGIPFEVVPGITSAIAGPAYAGIPVTHRGHNTSVTILTGHRWDASRIRDTYGALSGTLVILMGASSFPAISADLVAMGYDPETPVAAIRNATLPTQEIRRGTLSSLAEGSLASPSVIVVGSVVSLSPFLSWYERRCAVLRGKRVLVMRTPQQVAVTSAALAPFGATAVDGGRLVITPLSWDRTVLEGADAVVVTSANTVDILEEQGALAPSLRYVAIGPKTKEALASRGIAADMPPAYTSEGLGTYLLSTLAPMSRVVALRSAKASGTLASLLSSHRFCEVPVYDISYPLVDESAIRGCDIVFFTSTAMVHALSGIVPPGTLRISIGPVTSAALRAASLPPHAEARESTVASMIEAAISCLYRDTG